MKKALIPGVVIAVIVGGVVIFAGFKAGWFEGNDGQEVVPAGSKVPEALPELVEWIDKRIGSGDRKQESEGYTELSKPETYKRILAAVDDEKNPLPLRKRTLLLAAREHSKVKDLLPVLRKHAGDPQSPLRGEAVVALAGLPHLERLDKGGYITVTLATAAKDASPQLRLSATHGLVKLKSKAAVQALVERLSDSEAMLRKLAANRLKKLAGKDLGYKYSRSPKSQKDAIARWQAWAAKYEPKP